MAIRPRPDSDKAIEVVLFLAERLRDPTSHSIAKTLYAADHKHLGRYGRFICADRYIAMKYGPVPSRVYDMLKMARAEVEGATGNTVVRAAFSVSQTNPPTVTPNRAPDMDLLSASEVQALEEAIAEMGHLGFGERTDRTHGPAWKATPLNGEISIEEIAKELPNADEVLEHLRS
jgi:hypothetical protein